MVSLNSFMSADPVTAIAISDLLSQTLSLKDQPSLLCVFYDSLHDDALVVDFLAKRFPGVPVLGGTSCGGGMTEQGLGGEGSIAILAITDPDGDYGTASTRIGDDAAASAEQAIHAALDNAGCPGELPELIWIYQAPGHEEAVIAGLRRVVGDRCPIIGGSSADNEVAGQWRQLGTDGVMTDGLVVGVLLSSGGIGFAFQGGYEPAGASGVVTKVAYEPNGATGVVTQARGRRIITIDHKPAAEVYDRWTDGLVSSKLITGGNILADTSMHPLGIDAGRIEDVTHYLVVHPDQVLEGGVLSTFAEVEEGTRLYSMRGDKSRLVDRAGKVSAAAVANIPGATKDLAGALIVYCAGCKMAVGEQMDGVAHAITKSLRGAPFVGCFTFGEQGVVLNKNAHGNLMISAVVFGR